MLLVVTDRQNQRLPSKHFCGLRLFVLVLQPLASLFLLILIALSSVVFSKKALKTDCTLPAQHHGADRQSQQLAGEHSGAFSN